MLSWLISWETAIKLLTTAMGVVSTLLQNADKNSDGFDDVAARVLDIIQTMIERIASGKFDKVLLLSVLDLAQTVCENLDADYEEFDDEIARKIEQIRKSIDLDK